MAHPPERSEPSEPGSPLSRAEPGLARRLGVGGAGVSGEAPVPHFSFDPSGPRPGFLKRVERYVSGILKLGRTYTMVKETRKWMAVNGARMDGISSSIATIRDWQNHHETRMHDVEDRVDNREADTLPDGLIDLPKDLLDLEERLDRRLSKATDKTAKAADRTAKAVGRTAKAIHEARTEASGIAKDVERLRTEMAETAGEMRDRFSLNDTGRAGLSRAYGDLSRRLDMVRADGSALPAPAPEMTGLDALMESFYARLEDRYRGSREEIRNRLVQYLPDTEAAVERTGKPVLDLGCGRGEWLELLRGRGVAATGVDLNEMQLREARALDLDVHLGDACRFLADAPDGGYGMITAHHLAEHLPFRTLAWMTREALRVLAPGGVLLYETPNIGNILVGASSFHIDPTHVRPLPDAVLTTLLDTLGFHPVESRFLHPSTTHDKMIRDDRLDPVVAHLLFGPQDLAVLGTRPDGAA